MRLDSEGVHLRNSSGMPMGLVVQGRLAEVDADLNWTLMRHRGLVGKETDNWAVSLNL